MSYKQSITDAMTECAKDSSTVFVGYGLKRGKANGTLSGVPESRLRELGEMPVAENLMMGVAIGLSLVGMRVIVYYERFDFALLAADAIVNQLDKIKAESRGEFSPGVMIRCNVGGKTRPLYTGSTHTQDHYEAFTKMVSFPVVKHTDPMNPPYMKAFCALPKSSTMIVEYRDLY